MVRLAPCTPGLALSLPIPIFDREQQGAVPQRVDNAQSMDTFTRGLATCTHQPPGLKFGYIGIQDHREDPDWDGEAITINYIKMGHVDNDREHGIGVTRYIDITRREEKPKVLAFAEELSFPWYLKWAEVAAKAMIRSFGTRQSISGYFPPGRLLDNPMQTPLANNLAVQSTSFGHEPGDQDTLNRFLTLLTNIVMGEHIQEFDMGPDNRILLEYEPTLRRLASHYLRPGKQGFYPIGSMQMKLYSEEHEPRIETQFNTLTVY